jgi:hypothetical protein
MAKHKGFSPPEHPKQCPCGHKHLSWTMGDDHVFCWDCNRNYSYSECFSSRTPVSLADAPKEQLTLFEPDAEPINGLNTDSEKEPNG